MRGKHIEKTIIRYSSSAQSDCGSNVDHPVGTLDAALENEKSIFARIKNCIHSMEASRDAHLTSLITYLLSYLLTDAMEHSPS